MSSEDGRRRRRGHDEEAGESYFVSMSDLMAGVLFLFIIMLTNFALMIRNAPPASAKTSAASQASRAEALKLEQAKAQAAKTVAIGPAPPPDARTAALLALADYLKARRVDVTVDTAAGALRFPNDALFAGGGAALSPNGQAAVSALAGALQQVLPCFTVPEEARPASCPKGTGRVGAVFVEGHADTGAPSDWSNSVNQGSAAFQSLIAAQPSLQGLQSGSGQSLLSVSGYGPTRPIAPGDRKANSRLDLRLVLAS